MTQNPYEVLGIREGADMDEIKRAYRKKAKEFHPDLHPEDPHANEKMQQINAAYDMLCNPDKYRAQQQPQPDPYAGRAYDGYARQGGQYDRGGWQYTYYTADEDVFRAWQQAWEQAEAQQREARPIRRFSPLRAAARFIAGVMVIRLVVSFIRIMLFGFLG